MLNTIKTWVNSQTILTGIANGVVLVGGLLVAVVVIVAYKGK